MELPADELVVVRVLRRRDEVSPPVRVQTETQQVLLAQGREEIEPVVRVGEARDLVLANADLHQDLVLGERGPFCVFWRRLFLLRRRLVAARVTACYLSLQTEGSG